MDKPIPYRNNINLQDPIGKFVGKRHVRDAVAYGRKLQEAAGTFQRSAGFTLGPKGVFRFRTFEEADRWLMRIQTRPKT